NRIAFTDNGTDVSAVWEAGDQIYVVCNGKISLLTLKTGAGTKSGTFAGDLAGYSGDNKPAANTELICYVRNKRLPNIITVLSDGTFTDNRDFTKQNGRVETVPNLTIYKGIAKYGTGSNIVVNFSIYDTCLMKFEVNASNGIEVSKQTALSYYQGDTEMARCGRTANVHSPTEYYLIVPAGSYDGPATLKYTNETLTGRTIALGNKTTAITLVPGKLYVKTGLEPEVNLSDYLYEDGKWGDIEEHPNGKKAIARVCKLGTYDDDYADGYKRGYAAAILTTNENIYGTFIDYIAEGLYTLWGEHPSVFFSHRDATVAYSGLSETLALSSIAADDYGMAAKAARNHTPSPPSTFSSWFLPSLSLFKEAVAYGVYDGQTHSYWTITEKAEGRSGVIAVTCTYDDALPLWNWNIELSTGKSACVHPFIAF
ncbi:MAG: hypothetical protein J6M53_07455, partial [Bacteroidaceae bacterium]|nr:hypothetical protein [Bacteroidaceae bacterium]